MDNNKLSAIDRVKAFLMEKGINHIEIKEMPGLTKTAQQAADALGCEPSQIGKSIIFKTSDNEPVLVITSGPNRVNEAKVSEALGKKVSIADADFVRLNTGYAIGGVPPFAHTIKPITFIDEDLMQFDEVWEAGGTPYALFKINREVLMKLTDARPLDIK